VELGGQPCEALQRLTFLMSKEAPIHVVPIEMQMLYLALLFNAYVDCALHVGSCMIM
jgi:hypothetical protein